VNISNTITNTSILRPNVQQAERPISCSLEVLESWRAAFDLAALHAYRKHFGQTSVVIMITVTMPSVTVLPVYISSVLTDFPLLIAYLLVVFTGFAPVALAALLVTPLS
jgi:membrane protein required for beta-lactamase induction